MNPLVIDTDVLSYCFKDDSRMHLFVRQLPGFDWRISSQTEAELYQWASGANWGRTRRQHLEAFLADFKIVPSSCELSLKWAEVMVGARRPGRRIDVGDAWIAATALALN